MMIKDMPNSEKPRERMLKYGVENISNEELISIIIKAGTKALSAKNIAALILAETNDISELKTFNLNKLNKIKGIGNVKAIELMASMELGRRIYYEPVFIPKKKLNNPKDIYEFFKYKLNDKKQEHFYCIYLDNQKNLIDYKLLFVGTLNMSVVHPREIFKEAYLLSAASFICLHNHPTGSVIPSKEDRELTSKLIEIGKLLGINLIDHIIIGNNDYYSFFDNNDIHNNNKSL